MNPVRGFEFFYEVGSVHQRQQKSDEKFAYENFYFCVEPKYRVWTNKWPPFSDKFTPFLTIVLS